MPEFNPDEYLSSTTEFNPDEYLGVIPESANNLDVPTIENMAAEQARSDAIPERTTGEVVEGAIDTALTLGTGATSGALGFGVGTVGGIIGELTGMLKPGEGLELAEELATMLTRAPRSEAGKEYTKNIGKTLGVLPPVGLTGGVIPKFSMTNSPLGKKIAETGSERIKKDFTKKLGEDRFTPRIFGMVKKARSQGFDDGMTTMIANSPAIDKSKFSKMVKVMERGKGKTLDQQRYRPADVAGDSLLQDVNFLRAENKKAGNDLGKIAKDLSGEPVDTSIPTNKFFDDLGEMGVKIDNEGVLDFTDSLIEFSAPAKTLITNTMTKIQRRPNPDALEAHNFKKFLDEDLSHGKKQEGGVSGSVENLLGGYRKGINEAIGESYPDYKDANKRFSETITGLNDLQDVVGRKLNQTGPHADKAFGTALRGLMNNTKGRANLMTAVDNIQETSKKFGGRNQGDILAQMLFADELEVVFGGAGRTGLKSQVKQASVDAAVDISQMTGAGMIAQGVKTGYKFAKGVNEKNQLKAIKALLNAK